MKHWKTGLLFVALTLAGWMLLVARYAPQADPGFQPHHSLLILLPAAWRGLRPSLPARQGL